MDPSRFAPPSVIGHRGAAGLAPENTLAGLRAAILAGLRWVELDVKLTQDGVAILMHDDRLDRTTDGEGLVAETKFSDILRLDAGCWFAPRFLGQRVPTLAEAIGEMGRLGLGCNIEIKPCPGRAEETARAVVKAVKGHWPGHLPPPILSSFDAGALAAARVAGPDLALGYLATELKDGWRQAVASLGCVSVHLGAKGFTPEHAQAVRAAGLSLMIYTVNDPDEAKRLRAQGVGCLITDRPDRVGLG